MQTFVSFLIAFLVVYFSMPLFRRLAIRLDILDLPGARKIHNEAIPRIGGAAVYLGFLAGLLFNLRDMQFFLPTVAGATIILIVGLIDDKRKLNVQSRLLAQLLASLIVISYGVRISFLPPGFWGDTAEIIITLLWIIGVTNAYNYLDGMDGLAAGSTAINLLCFAAILYQSGQFPLGILAFVLMGACLGFLPYNFSKKKVFLGDSGSTFLGFVLASISLDGAWAEDNLVKIFIPVLILGVPIFDMIFTTIMRIKEEKVKTVLEWLRYGGKDHFHHYLVDIGLSTKGAVLLIYAITFALGLSAIMVSNDKAIEGFLAILQASMSFVIVAILMVVGKRRRSGWKNA